ncbi:MAG TPA: SRPBCC family protein [Rhizomicrobium sp.]|jgi:uncharacterized protein YndB with AHSA1/START domain|nr:SRPBCC family protein [Rhizomicrobium sp.]
MAESKFVYVTYIRTTAERLWDALTRPEFTRAYWAETIQHSKWTPGSAWEICVPDGRVWDSGEILEVDHPRRLVLTWRNEHFPEMKAEGFTCLTYEIEPFGDDAVKLMLTHEIAIPGSKVIAAVSNGWPAVLASLKSLLETGEALSAMTKWKDCA